MLPCVWKESDDYLLQPPAPNPEIMNRIGIILAQNLGQQSQAFAQPGLEKLLQQNPNRRGWERFIFQDQGRYCRQNIYLSIIVLN